VIIEGLLSLLMLILLGLVSLLPSYTPPSGADLSAFSVIAWLVPVGELSVLAAVMVAAVVATLGYTLVNWVINKARGSG